MHWSIAAACTTCQLHSSSSSSSTNCRKNFSWSVFLTQKTADIQNKPMLTLISIFGTLPDAPCRFSFCARVETVFDSVTCHRRATRRSTQVRRRIWGTVRLSHRAGNGSTSYSFPSASGDVCQRGNFARRKTAMAAVTNARILRTN